MNPKNKAKENEKTKDNLPIKQAITPEKDHPDNAKMVAEGSQFGIEY
ncbi:hypothetical protein [Salinibacillus xinjiangensis]|uniref:Uncharacterized protein n=1 Tax=Salinibacillus xinjiangensis TaxID=1229268 RepID=A0A6G1XB11_9BACI|nr:hypothetical protein [Salinibacillus xinjiangensis]MRG88122.1 hypothetical protein [Salinibacillus xinjiangensis]